MRRMSQVVPVALFAIAMSHVTCNVVAAETANDTAIQQFLDKNFAGRDCGMVIAIVERGGMRSFSAGTLGDLDRTPVTSNTIFEIGSATKTFTALLAQEMASRGEVKLDDPVASCLPTTATVPSRNGKVITLENLAAQESGFPHDPDNYTGKNYEEAFRTYTVAGTYDFLSRFKLPQDPGEKYRYSNFGMGLLGHALSRKLGKTYESLVIDRICQPLQMDDTRISLSPEQAKRFAQPHDDTGKPTKAKTLTEMGGAGALRSTTNDLCKYVSANVGLTSTPLFPLMQAMQVFRHNNYDLYTGGQTAMPWYDSSVYNPPGSRLMAHAGGTGGSASFIGLDTAGHRGVVVLSNQSVIHPSMLGWRILQRASLANLDPITMTPVWNVAGTGIILAQDEKKALIAKGVRPGSPSSKVDIQSGDTICSVNGVTAGLDSLDEAARLMRGAPGTTVVLELLRGNSPERHRVEVLRASFVIGA